VLRLGGGRRLLPRSVAIAVLTALAVALFAAPALADSRTPGGVTDPNTDVTNPPPDSSSTSSTSTSTTTTTKPRKKPTKKPNPKKDPAGAETTPADGTPSAGPPEVAKAGLLLPDDSVQAATEELALERAKVDLIGRRRTNVESSILEHENKLDDVRKETKHEQQQRQDRAVATYRGQASGWSLGVVTHRGLTQEREVYLVAAADAAAREKIKSLQQQEKSLEEQLKLERAERLKVGQQLDEAVRNVNLLLDKLAANTGSITLVDGVLTYVPTGPSPVALLADSADLELNRLILTSKARATDPSWQAAAKALATEIAKGKGLDGKSVDALMREWAVTPPNVLHAMLFALRQVGKAYVYATAGPTTFDCSGLTKAAYAQIRLGLPHFSGAQLHIGIPVAPEALRPGDLLTYGPDGSEHVTMYIGDGLVVEAKGRAYGVIVGQARVDPTKGFAGATRIVP
jgi:cell wall-associated NlpC family hydrolase